MRTPITLRLDADLLAAARVEARRDSRSLTNLVEVALKRHLGRTGTDGPVSAPGRGAARGSEGAGVPPGGASGKRP